ncbi:MAG: copper transport protein [Pseudonocardiales bacterium]|nr:copper transport protein [Pseudonocardiales bacterium]
MAGRAGNWPRRVRLAVAVLAMSAGLVVLSPSSPASAHAFLTDSNPADGAVLAAAPGTLRLQFSESVVIAATRIDIVDSGGHHYKPTALRLVHTGSGDSTEEPAQIVGDLPALARSAYRVSWETLSSDDLHRTSGLLVFGVNEQVTAAPFVEPTPRLEEAALRWLLLLCLAGALGAALAVRLYRRVDGDSQGDGVAVARARRISIVGSALGIVVAAGLLVDQLVSSGSPAGRLLTSSYGARWALREVGFAALLAATWLGQRPGRRSPWPRAALPLLLGVGAACACLGSALLGHAGAGQNLALTRVLADAAHLGAAATWSGLLIVALLVIVPQVRRGGAAAVAARAVLRGFGLPAAGCVGVMVVTGVYLASGVVGSVDAALLTFYGRTLMIKVAVFGAVVVLGLVNARRLHASGPRPTPRRTVFAEGVLAVVILGLAAVLVSGQPAREPQFVKTPVLAAVPVVDTQVADLQESLAIRPNQPGRNVVLVDVFDTRRPAPAPIRRVLVSIIGLDGRDSAPVAADRLADGRWSVATGLDAPGRTRVRITVQRAGLPDATHLYRWTVTGGAQHTRPATVSTAPLGGLLENVALALAVLLGLGGSLALWRRRAKRRPTPLHRRGDDAHQPEHAAPADRDLVGAG